MWVVKSHGVTFYVNHVSAEIPWSTKETPDNDHTKGSLKFKKCKLTIDDDNCATLSKLGLLDHNLPTPKRVFIRIISRYNSDFHKALIADEFKHSDIKNVSGGCGTSFVVCDLLDDREVTFATIKYGTDFRIMQPNERYYQAYDEKMSYIDEDDYPDLDDE